MQVVRAAAAVEEGAGDDEAVDLNGALEDAVDVAIQEDLLGRVISDEARVAEVLRGVVDHGERGVAAPDLGHGGLHGVIL